MSNPFQVVKDFEAALCEYTGAKYAVTTNSCTMAILLALRWDIESRLSHLAWNVCKVIHIPRRTYVSVPQCVKHVGAVPEFYDLNWIGSYQLHPSRTIDSARYFTSDMYTQARGIASMYQCVSFHASKILGDSQGGAILHDDDDADKWFRKARFDGRTEGVSPKDDNFDMLGYHCYMSPDVAARLLHKLSVLPKNNEPLPNDDYPDLSQFEVFK